MFPILVALAWLTVGAIGGVLVTRAMYRRNVLNLGRGARAPVCNSCPFVTPEQRTEIAKGRTAELPPALSLPILDGSGSHPAG